MKRKRNILSAVVSAVIFVLVMVAWYWMFTQTKSESFAQRGFGSLKFFTVDSNLLMAAAALIHLIFMIRVLRGAQASVPGWVEQLFYAGTTSVSLTFAMVMVYLGPAFGYREMFAGFNLYLHLIVPVLSIFALCLLHRDRKISLKDSFIALIPLLLYGIYYMGMIVRFGLNRPKTDWYWLAVGGEKWIPAVFFLIVICTWGIALLLRLAVNGFVNTRKENMK